LKDVTKIISERATRFLPVDMKDRLKSAFNRNSGNAAPADQQNEDLPDYSAIFNANKSTGNQKQSHSAGPVDQSQLAEPTASQTMRDPGRQIANGNKNDHIEDAEIVAEPSSEATMSIQSAPAANESNGWESVSLKSSPKQDTTAEASRPAPRVADDAPDYSAIFKGSKPRPADNSAPRPHFEASPAKSETRPDTREDGNSHFAAELKPSKPASAAPTRAEEPRKPEVVAQSATREQPTEKPKPRFFNGDFNSTESVRLKVDKRPDERPAVEAIATNISPPAAEATPAQAKAVAPKPMEVPKPVEAKPLSEERPAPVQAQEPSRPAPAPKEAPRSMPENVAIRPAAFESGKINIQPNPKVQKETASMDAKGHESDNGAAVRTEGASVAAIAIERNSKFSGQLKFSGAIAIDGQVEGELVAERVVVHEGGVVNATVEGNTVVIAGNVKGDVYARNELEILPSGVVNGSVTAPAINVRRGGRVEGRCSIGVPRQ
jgi:cytoskeletal protein CcmA (bactofilin family)